MGVKDEIEIEKYMGDLFRCGLGWVIYRSRTGGSVWLSVPFDLQGVRLIFAGSLLERGVIGSSRVGDLCGVEVILREKDDVRQFSAYKGGPVYRWHG